VRPVCSPRRLKSLSVLGEGSSHLTYSLMYSMKSLGLITIALIGLSLSKHVLASSGPSVTTLYTPRTLPIYADAQGQLIAGTITPGTPLRVLGLETDGLQAFTLDAWCRQDDTTTLVASKSQRIVLAVITGGQSHLRTLSTVKDDYGIVWNQVELSGFVEGNALTPDQDSIWAQAQALYSARCGTCHALRPVDEFTSNQWPPIVKSMAKRAALQPEQAELITQYLQTHARQ
jgi:hypothetical protein